MKGNQKIKTSICLMSFILVIAIIAISVCVSFIQKGKQVEQTIQSIVDPEILRSLSYEQITEAEEKGENEYVKFLAFFTRDLDNDGYAERLKGTCREVSDTDELYIELNVLTEGYLRNGVIKLNAENFTWETAIVADNIVSGNYIGNTSSITLNNKIEAGSQKILWGKVKSNINNNINNYSKEATITLTGTHVSADGKTETPINKTVKVMVDWHGDVGARITNTSLTKNINDINLTDDTIGFQVSISTQETIQKLLLKENVITAEIPKFNGYAPVNVITTGDYEYDENTQILTVRRSSIVDENGNITQALSRYNSIDIEIEYPVEAYSIDQTSIRIEIPITTYYVAYNNGNKEFGNPTTSNVAKDVVKITYKKPVEDKPETVGNYIYDFDIKVGTLSQNSKSILKRKPISIYNGNTSETTEDYYEVIWELSRGKLGDVSSIVMKETPEKNTDEFLNSSGEYLSMLEYVDNVGISFYGAAKCLGEDGYINVYNDDTNELIHKFTKEDWNEYTEYKNPVKHIRIETSAAEKNSFLSVTHVKEINDELLVQDYLREEFDELEYIYSYLQGSVQITGQSTMAVSNKVGVAEYVEEESNAKIYVEPNMLESNKTVNNFEIKINVVKRKFSEVLWKNSQFIVKVPSEIIAMDINKISIDSYNVKVVGYDLYEDGNNYFLKIITENDIEARFNVLIDCNVTTSPSVASSSKYFELYAYNELSENYTNNAKDEYDVNGNNNIEENVGYDKDIISFKVPSSIITTQYLSNYDETEKIKLAPNIADILQGRKQANINLVLINNYSRMINEVKIVGVIPTVGNSYIVNGADLGSQFSVNMNANGIQVPKELKDIVTIYYSEKINPTKELADSNNEWKRNPDDWTKIKSYMIDFGDYIVSAGSAYTFTYGIEIPEDVIANKTSYSEHAVYFALDTEGGKLLTQTEPNKLGMSIRRKVGINVTKHKLYTDIPVGGATYKLYEKNNTNELQCKLLKTDENGQFNVEELYVGTYYILKEVSSPTNYQLNQKEIEFYITEDEPGKIQMNTVPEGGFSGESTYDAEKNIMYVQVEDEPKYNLTINKVSTTGEPIKGAIFEIKETQKSYATNKNGQIMLSNLIPNKIYTIVEKKADGYFIDTTEKSFKLAYEKDSVKIETQDGNFSNVVITNEDTLDVQIYITNQKIPTFDLQILKVEEGKSYFHPLVGATFELYSDDSEKVGVYTTDSNGTINISGLYAHVDGQMYTGRFRLKEISAPDGYATSTDEITFVVNSYNGQLSLQFEDLACNTLYKSSGVNGDKVTLITQNKPVFKVLKIDDETGKTLPNAKFVIYRIDASEEDYARDVNGNYIGEKNEKGQYIICTDENGSFTAPLPNGTYKIVEVEPPEGYEDVKYEDTFKITNNTYKSVSLASSQTRAGSIGITYIEDLLNISSGSSGTYYYLNRTLDFEDDDSYKNPNSTYYGDINKDGTIEGIKAELTDKIDGLGFPTIKTMYNGGFNGCGYEIRNIYISSNSNSNQYSGLFGYVENSRIQNLKVTGYSKHKGTYKNNTSFYGGGLIGYALNSTVMDCINDIEIMNEYVDNGYLGVQSYAGGIAAYAKQTTFSSCTNMAYLNTKVRTGGIVGVAEKCNFYSCTNIGSLNGTSSYGGIAGIINGGGTVRGCYNEGSIINYTQYGYRNMDSPGIGGIIGEITGGNNGTSIDSCYNLGYVRVYSTGGMNGTNIGGIVGSIGGYNVSLNNCYNKGSLSATNATNFYVGGLIGDISGNINYSINIGYSYNVGNISSTGYAGGVIGDASGRVNITNAYYLNEANLSGNNISTYGTGLPKEQMTTKEFYKNLNLYNVWMYRATNYPILQKGLNQNVKEVTNIVVMNTIKKYNITAEIELNSEGRRDVGTITKEDNSEFTEQDNIKDIEIVKHNNNSAQSIKIKPIENYKIAKITINDKILKYTLNEDGSVVIPVGYFQNVIENKHIKVIFENNNYEKIKKYKITTKVVKSPIQDKDGGTISGQGENPYEEVAVAETSKKDIIVNPDENYRIVSIMVNGEEIKFSVDENGNVLMKKFENMQEDKEVVVRFEPVYEKNIKILKLDEVTQKPLEGIQFAIYYLSNGNDFAKDKNGTYIGTKDENGMYLISTDKNGEINLALPTGYYKAVEVKGTEGYLLAEKEEDRTTYFNVVKEISEEINYIEDLIELSNNVTNGNTYEGKEVHLLRDLNFNDFNSYRNANDTTYGDYNGDGVVQGIKDELTNTSGCGFKPIGTDMNHSFKGVFDGNGFQIKNLYINCPYGALFVKIENGVICNLKLSDVNVTAYSCGGALARNIHKTKITNCSFTGNMYGKYNTSLCPSGGLVYSAVNSEITYCCNNTNVEGVNIGGIASELNNCLLENCYNTGKVVANGPAGGIASIINNCIIKNVYNTGDISGTGCTGGIGSSIQNSTLTNVYNTGKITDTYAPAGGLTYSMTGCEIRNCYNTGEVSGQYIVGGLAGSLSKCNVSKFANYGNIKSTVSGAGGVVATVNESTIKDCYNEGNVCIEKINNSGNNGVGGFAGTISNTNIQNCYNKGTITSEDKAGGFALIINNSNIENAYNESEVISKNATGGFAYKANNNSTLKYCFNTGNVIGGEIFGAGFIVEADSVNIIKCYNTGNVDSSAPCAGFIYSMNGSKIQDCYNTGNTIQSVDTSGGFTYSVQNSQIFNCYNTGNTYGKNAAYAFGICKSGTIVANCYNVGSIKGDSTKSICNSSSDCTKKYIYFLNTSISWNTTSVGIIESRTMEQMKSIDFVTQLNNNKNSYTAIEPFSSWKIHDNNYPTFDYEIDTTPIEIQLLKQKDKVINMPEIKTSNSPKNYEITESELYITNAKISQITVHHYLQGTGPEFDNEPIILAPNEVIIGKENHDYITSPKLDIEGYSLIRDTEGDYVIPKNATGKFTVEPQDIYYYYNVKPLELIVHHYLEGTENKLVDDEHYFYNENEHYKTNPSKSLLEAYELALVVGDEEKDITQNEVVTYYYKHKKVKITTKVEIPAEEAEFGRTEKGGTILGEGEKPYETVNYGENSKKDIIATPDSGYKLKSITVNGEVVPFKIENGSITISKFENMKEDKEVVVTFTPLIGKVITHHYLQGTTEKLHEDVITEGKLGEVVQTSAVEIDKYKLVSSSGNKDENGNVIIVKEVSEGVEEIIYYYQIAYIITTDVIEHTETYKNGTVVKNVKGGSITAEDVVIYEQVMKYNNNEKTIEMKHDKDYEIVEVRINGKTFDVEDSTQVVETKETEIAETAQTTSFALRKTKKTEDLENIENTENSENTENMAVKEQTLINSENNIEGVTILSTLKLDKQRNTKVPNGFFTNVQTNIHVEVQYRRNSKVTVKYLEKDTEIEVASSTIISGYEGKEFETIGKIIPGYKFVKVPISENSTEYINKITDENNQQISPNGTMFSDDITVVYWYEKVDGNVIERHIETNEKGEEIELDYISYNDDTATTIETVRKNYDKYGAIDAPEATKKNIEANYPNVVLVDKNKNSYTVEVDKKQIKEVWYYYIKQYNITTEVKTHKEINNGKEVDVAGGTISKEYSIDEHGNKIEITYEVVNSRSDNKKEIKIVPDNGYRIKSITINNKEIFIGNLISRDGTVTLPAGYIKDIQMDYHVSVEFEKIPAKITVKYIDEYTKESILPDKTVEGFVNDEYNEPRVEVEGYVGSEPEPENSTGKMTEEGIVIIYYYIKQFEITTDVIEHLEDEDKGIVDVKVENNDEDTAVVPEKQKLVKGGSIQGEDETPYEAILRGKHNTKEILIKPDEGYRIKTLKIKDGKTEYVLSLKELLTKENTIILPVEYFENIQSNKHIEVEFEQIPAKVIVNYLDYETKNNEVPDKVAKEEIGEGFINDEYKTHEKQILYYELVKDEIPENAEGKLEEESVIVNYWYRRLPFNMKISKEFSSIIMNGKDISIDNTKLVKIDIANTEIENADIRVKYKICVTNTAQIPGTATVIEQIPVGFKFTEAENDSVKENAQTIWKQDGTQLVLTTKLLKPGETEEYELELQWDKQMKCIGILENIAKISKTHNVPEFEEETLKDNRDSCVLILSIRTRENRDIKKFISLGCFAMAGICAVAYVGSEIYFRRKE